MLYIIRHGLTDWNKEYRLQGRTNIPLNQEGIEMAQKAAEKYRDIPFDVCYCSPLDRARKTAELLTAGRNISVIPDDRLLEMCFGECEGVQNIFEKPDCPMYNFFKDPLNYIPPKGAETFDDLFTRTGSFLKEIAYPLVQEGKNVLIVGHGAMNNSIISQVRNIPIKDFWTIAIPNCEIIQLI